MLLIIGLVLTVVGWIIQLFRIVVKKDPKLNPVFLVVYAAGCVLLAAGNFLGRDAAGGILNVLDAILPAIILVTLTVVRKTT